jgi:hypothetical protein
MSALVDTIYIVGLISHVYARDLRLSCGYLRIMSRSCRYCHIVREFRQTASMACTVLLWL